MSLTGLLKTSPDLRDLLDAALKPAPALRVPPPQVPRLCAPDRANVVGTANDYALRWRLERYYRIRGVPVVLGPWVAEHGAQLSRMGSVGAEAGPLVQNLLDEGRRAHARFVGGDEKYLSAESCRALLGLAALDFIYRQGDASVVFAGVPKEDVQDLMGLARVRDEALLGGAGRVVLNPHFGQASELVGGADADFLLDGLLVDLKTVLRPNLTAEVRRQLLGYVVCWQLNGERVNEDLAVRLEEVGVCFGRHGYTVREGLEELTDVAHLPRLAREFKTLVRGVGRGRGGVSTVRPQTSPSPRRKTGQ
ncbi:hypothetical protein [Deinococcus aestuarii]|uniref:hypothetical protein n=1 Tax=Deinococcus aestuarii TaxID=2774531 RepID=UPI001C0C119B|nr:hypothetical protein [Deinococcus aestuarii]